MMNTFFALFFLSVSAHAQMALLPDSLRAIPEISSGPMQKRVQVQNQSLKYSRSQINQLAEVLDSQFKFFREVLDKPAPGCAKKNEIENYLLALQIKGNLDLCAETARQCEGKATGPKIFLIGALCESTRFNYTKADHFFELATDSNWKASPDYTEALFQRAAYSLYGHHEDLVDGILQKIPSTTSQDQVLWKALLRRVGEIDLGDIQKRQVDLFLTEKINSSTESLKGLLLSLQIRIATRDHRYAEAIGTLLKRSHEIDNPLHWYYAAYNALYYGLDQNFSWSQKIYDTYNNYSQPWLSFPLETNTYNYTEIYSSICRESLVQETSGQDFYEIKKSIREGRMTVGIAQQKLNGLKEKYSQKADYLAAVAGLFALQGSHAEAFDLYWKSHQLCPYYNRANWGLALEKRFAQHSNRPDYNELNSHLDQELQGRKIPEVISSYILNWNSLNPEVQKRVVFGSRIWLPFMQTLSENEMHSYIKYAFDLLSDSPNLKGLRDQRIGGQNYPNDNRLWDDVRGVGGETVVADLAEVYQGVQGDYNLLGHEIAHQFHFLMVNTYPIGARCIENQYAAAKARNNFPDSYSSQNKEEHFAQGVTYCLVPENSPARFGLNQSWVKRKNISQFKFIESIDRAAGNLNQIFCDY